MIQGALTENLLIPSARALLLCTFGIGIIQALREGEELDGTFERLGFGFLCLMFYPSVMAGLLSLSGELSSVMEKMGPKEGLKDFVLDSLIRAGSMSPMLPGAGWKQAVPQAIGVAKAAISNGVSFTTQAIRTGVWGVVASIADFCFLAAEFILECARDVLWQILLALFPIACGVFPALPRILENCFVFAVEIALWIPMLKLVDSITSRVARQYVLIPESLGLYVVAVEIVAIALTLLIPSIAHKAVHGALSADLGASSSVMGHVRRIVAWRI